MSEFQFKKNDRGYSDISFRFMRQTIIRFAAFLNKPRMINVNNMPLTGPCFIYANHSNNLDPFLINHEMTREPTAGVMTRYQFFNTLPRIFMSSIGVVPTSKYVPDPGVIRKVIQMVDQNRMIMIFPEGGRRWDGRPKPLIEATLKLFWKMRIPVHAVQIHGSYLAWPRWADRPRRNSMELHWMTPLNPADFRNYDSFAETCRKQIHFDENDPPATALPYSAYKPALGIQRLLYRCPESGIPDTIYTPDGRSVRSRKSDKFFYHMDKNSRLVNSEGTEFSLVEFYDRINKMPMPEDSQSTIIPDKSCTLFHIDSQYTVHKLGRAYMRLKNGEVEINRGADQYRFPIDKIRYNSIEKNHKLMLTTHDATYMADLGKNSVLQWQIFLRRLQQGEQTVRSM